MDNITELNKLIYAGGNLVCYRINSEQKYKTLTGNEARKKNKETATTIKTTREGKTYRNQTDRNDLQH